MKYPIVLITEEQYNKNKAFAVEYGFTNSPFGPCIIGLVNNECLCYLAFYENNEQNSAVNGLRDDWPNAILSENNNLIESFGSNVFENGTKPLKVILQGTDFQLKVWQELTKIRPGAISSYENIAQAIGKPSAVRAVASAIAKNKVSYVIPCHRVIHKSGTLSKYRWGVNIKRSMLEYENIIIS